MPWTYQDKLTLLQVHNENFDCGLEVRSIYLDMSKAFDKVWHEGLIFKLKQNGIEGKLLNLFESYLTNCPWSSPIFDLH